jgi:hypothetical protein
LNIAGLRRTIRRGLASTIRGSGTPHSDLAFEPLRRMEPLSRNFAADAHYCIMVQVSSTHRIQVCGAMIRAERRIPLGTSRTVLPSNVREGVESKRD